LPSGRAGNYQLRQAVKREGLEVTVPLEAIVPLVGGLWIAAMVLVTSLCKMAKLGDEALQHDQRHVTADNLVSLDSLERRVREGAALRYPATGTRSPLVIVRTSSSRTTSARSLSI
jgi:hypothetical protein